MTASANVDMKFEIKAFWGYSCSSCRAWLLAYK